MTTIDEVRNAIAPKPGPAKYYDGVEVGDTVIVTPLPSSPMRIIGRTGQIAHVVDRVKDRLVLEFSRGNQTLAARNEVARVD